MSDTNTDAGARLVRTCRQTLHAAREQVFPLLCPEREKQWLPGWDARMIHSESGVAERGALFATRDESGAEVIWLFAEHVPPSRVHLVRWHPGTMVVDIELDLASPLPQTTWLDVRYAYTATSPAGRARIGAMTLDQWHAQMTHWETRLDAWLAAHPSRPAAA
jgi:hypothetical protein